ALFQRPQALFRHHVLIQDYNKEYGYQNEHRVKFVGAALILRVSHHAGKIESSTFFSSRGAIAQLGERIVRNDEVVGSIPTSSTNKPLKNKYLRTGCGAVVVTIIF